MSRGTVRVALETSGHVGSVYEIAVVPEKPWIVSVGQDDSILIWNSDTGQRVASLKGDGPYHCLSLPPSGSFFR